MAEPPESTPISFVISDVDGTLVTTGKVLTRRAQDAVHALQESGIGFAVTSSRPPRGLAMLIEPLRLVTPMAGFNGGVIVTPDMVPIEEHFVAPDAAQRTVEMFTAAGLEVWVFTNEAWIARDPDGAHVAHEQRTVQFPPTIRADFGAALERAGKVVGVSDDYDCVARCETQVRATLGAAATVARSQLYYLDVTHPEANKGAVVVALSRLLAIPPSAIVTIGDGENDVLMFAKSGLSIAMGNASAEVKAQAHFATGSCDEDGFAEAIERIVLPRAVRR
jgi:Cof subfamily protein (haloacid dehalogenase superfamily)